jgi:hypothetical protein
MEIWYVSCEVKTEILNIILMNFRLDRVEVFISAKKQIKTVDHHNEVLHSGSRKKYHTWWR